MFLSLYEITCMAYLTAISYDKMYINSVHFRYVLCIYANVQLYKLCTVHLYLHEMLLVIDTLL